MLVKSLHVAYHILHLEQAFDVLDFYHMKLNPKNCAFNVSLGQLLGYMVIQHRIETHLG